MPFVGESRFPFGYRMVGYGGSVGPRDPSLQGKIIDPGWGEFLLQRARSKVKSVSTGAIKLPRTLERFVAAQVEKGVYRSRQAAIVAAVAGEKRRAEQRANLSAEIQKGLDSGTAGPINMEDVIQRGRGRRSGQKRRMA